MKKSTDEKYLRPKYTSKNWFSRYRVEFLIIIFGLFFIHIFLFFDAFSGGQINPKNASEFGSFIGGYLGTLFALTSVVFLYVTLRIQRQSSEIEKFENNFFELIGLHKKNVEEIILKNQSGKKIFVLFIREFREILKYVKQIFPDNSSVIELINISYLAFFYGTGPNSTRILKSYLSGYPQENIVKLVNILEANKEKVMEKRSFNYKPFEGHQSRLGHYYRHLFQTVSFVDLKKIDIDKYEYVKILRAQLSNHEQALLALNSLSDLGNPWNEDNLIKRYRLIKNIPRDFFNSETEIDLKKYFKGLIFEYEENTG